MKRGTARHPKTERLMRLLGVDRKAAMGILELLVDFVREFAVRGDVGRWSDAEIAAACDYREGPPAALVAALVGAGYLDPCADHRLVLHDAEEHSDQAWRRVLERRKLTFATSRRLATDEPWLDNDVLARGVASDPGSSSDSGSEKQDPPAVVALAPVRPEPQGALTGVAVRNGHAKVRRAEPPDFVAFYEDYPRHQGRQEALAAWWKLRPDAALQERMRAALSWQRHLDQWQDPEKIPHPATWLNKRRWEDEPPRIPPGSMSRELRESLPVFERFLAKQRALADAQRERRQLEEKKA